MHSLLKIVASFPLNEAISYSSSRVRFSSIVLFPLAFKLFMAAQDFLLISINLCHLLLLFMFLLILMTLPINYYIFLFVPTTMHYLCYPVFLRDVHKLPFIFVVLFSEIKLKMHGLFFGLFIPFFQ